MQYKFKINNAWVVDDNAPRVQDQHNSNSVTNNAINVPPITHPNDPIGKFFIYLLMTEATKSSSQLAVFVSTLCENLLKEVLFNPFHSDIIRKRDNPQNYQAFKDSVLRDIHILFHVAYSVHIKYGTDCIWLCDILKDRLHSNGIPAFLVGCYDTPACTGVPFHTAVLIPYDFTPSRNLPLNMSFLKDKGYILLDVGFHNPYAFVLRNPPSQEVPGSPPSGCVYGEKNMYFAAHIFSCHKYLL